MSLIEEQLKIPQYIYLGSSYDSGSERRIEQIHARKYMRKKG